jgi:hypothetical protein
MTREEQEYIIDVDIPDDIDMEIDVDGLPMVVAREKPKAEPKPAKAVAAPDASPDKAVDDRLNTLTRERDEASRARVEAEATANAERAARLKAEGESAEGRQVALRAHWAKVQSDAQAIDATIASTKSQMNAARAEFKAAKDAGDTDRELKAHEILTQATHDFRDLEQGKRGVEAEAERVRAAYKAMTEEAERVPVVEPEKKHEPKQPTPDDWIDGIRKNVGGQVADWLSTNKQFVTDPKLNAKVIAFSQFYVADTEQPLNDPAFITALNDKFLPKPKPKIEPAKEEPDVADDDVEVEQPAKATSSVPSAPVSRGSAPGKPSSSGSMKVKLTAEQAAIAPHLYPDAKSPQEARQAYALDLVRAQKEGRFENRM